MIKWSSIKKTEKQDLYIFGLAPKRRILPKPARTGLVVVSVLTVLVVGGGLGYTWLLGQNTVLEEDKKTAEPQTKSVGVLGQIPELPPDAPVQASVRFVASPVMPGDNTSVEVHTRPKAKCAISVEYNDTPIKDSGLVDKVADEFGNASWSWTVDDAAPQGVWPVKITCKYAKKSGYVETYIEIKF